MRQSHAIRACEQAVERCTDDECSVKAKRAVSLGRLNTGVQLTIVGTMGLAPFFTKTRKSETTTDFTSMGLNRQIKRRTEQRSITLITFVHLMYHNAYKDYRAFTALRSLVATRAFRYNICLIKPSAISLYRFCLVRNYHFSALSNVLVLAC